MDSNNSGSMQSSSGGDEEYDSRAESISSFFNSSSHLNPISNPPQTQPSNHNPSSFFDSFSNYTFPQTPTLPNVNSLLNLDPLWSKTPPQSNCTHIGGLMGPSSSSSPFPIQNPSAPLLSITHNAPLRPSPGFITEGLYRESTSSAPTDQPNLIRNSKKRSRASRRAPTTVLTTDTSNFRAMVQEFTGIPAPPFSASTFPRNRFDLFASHSAPPPYLLRPFAQKPHQPSFPSSTMLDVLASSSTTTTSTSSNTNTTNLANTTNNFQHQNLPSMQNPLFAFQSLLQTPPPKYPLSNLPAFTSKSQGVDSQLKMGMLEEFTMNQGHVNTNLSDNTPIWGDEDGLKDGDQSHLRAFNGNYNNSQRMTSCKINYTASSSDFHSEKASENVSSRGEGMVDSWICSSD
ncbi:uncharacterized protein LOC143848644 [Tasmannia lanceolata]|uniref:uncharacterized protein LOC143848644 n=1 Tax=Tasmannia lanceolata TaxID=3420 RepID=UPI004063EA41